MKNILIVSLLAFIISCNNQDNEISELGNRFIKDVLSDYKPLPEYILVFTPSNCESCLEKGREVLTVLNNANNKADFIIISSESMVKMFKKNVSPGMTFLTISSSQLQRYGHIGNLGVLYCLLDDKNIQYNMILDEQKSNLKLIKSHCK